MPSYEFFDYVLSPGFLIMFGLVAAAFAPLGYSVLKTWTDNKYKVDQLNEQQREARQRRIVARRARAAARKQYQQQS